MTVPRYLTACVMLMFCGSTPFVRACIQGPEETAGQLSIRLSLSKNTFRLGESIRVKVEISNDGKSTLFVARNIELDPGAIGFLELLVTDAKGNVSPRDVSTPVRKAADPGESTARAVSKAWVALSPAYSYGTTLRIEPDSYEFLRKPGRYRLQATYFSLGMAAPVYYNSLADKLEEIEKLPFGSWKGKTESNSVWIEILPPRNVARGKK